MRARWIRQRMLVLAAVALLAGCSSEAKLGGSKDGGSGDGQFIGDAKALGDGAPNLGDGAPPLGDGAPATDTWLSDQGTLPSPFATSSVQTAGFGNVVDMTADSAGNVFVVGQFEGTLTFGTTTIVSAGFKDIYLAKYSPTGSPLWAVRGGGTSGDTPLAVAVDDKNAYVLGKFFEDATFGSVSVTKSSNSTSDLVVFKVDDTGTVAWATSLKVYAPTGGGIGVDAQGNVYISSSFYYSSATGKTSVIGSTTLQTAGAQDIFVAKLDKTGAPLWAVTAGGAGTDEARDLAVDEQGNSFVTGRFEGTATFGSHQRSSNGNWDTFVSKLDSSGNFVWAASGGGSYRDAGTALALGHDAGIYVTGTYTMNSTSSVATYGKHKAKQLGKIGMAAFTAKLDAMGNFVWATANGVESTGTLQSESIAVSKDGRVYVVGFANPGCSGGVLVFAPAKFSIPIRATAAYIEAMEASTGKTTWASVANGATDNRTHADAVAVSPSGEVHVGGSMLGKVNFEGKTISASTADFQAFLWTMK